MKAPKEIVEQAGEIIENAVSIHGKDFANYVVFHAKVHQLMDLLERAFLPPAPGRVVDLEYVSEAVGALLAGMDYSMAQACNVSDDKTKEACRLSLTIAEICTIKGTGDA